MTGLKGHDRWRQAVSALLLALVSLLSPALVCGEGLCTSCSIYILDLSTLAEDNGYPTCELDKIVTVNPDNGVVYLEDTKIPRKVSHKYGTHSAPWYLYKARPPLSFFI